MTLGRRIYVSRTYASSDDDESEDDLVISSNNALVSTTNMLAHSSHTQQVVAASSPWTPSTPQPSTAPALVMNFPSLQTNSGPLVSHYHYNGTAAGSGYDTAQLQAQFIQTQTDLATRNQEYRDLYKRWEYEKAQIVMLKDQVALLTGQLAQERSSKERYKNRLEDLKRGRGPWA